MKNNNINNLHYTIEVTGINELGILNGYIYTDFNKSKQNAYLKLIFANYNISDNNSTKNNNDNLRPVISYNLYSNRKLLNNWYNLDLFLITFPGIETAAILLLDPLKFSPCMGKIGFVTSF